MAEGSAAAAPTVQPVAVAAPGFLWSRLYDGGHRALFPRVQGPLWGMPQDALAGSTGLSDEMSPGSVSKLLTSDAVAFRATFRSEVPRANQLYWRGPVMWDFDGYTWTASRFGNALQRPVEYAGNAIDYTVTVEPHSLEWAVALASGAVRRPKRGILPANSRIRAL